MATYTIGRQHILKKLGVRSKAVGIPHYTLELVELSSKLKNKCDQAYVTVQQVDRLSKKYLLHVEQQLSHNLIRIGHLARLSLLRK